MPTDQERLTSLEQGVSDLNHNVTMLQGVVGSQGADIRAMKEQLERMGIRLDAMDAHLAVMDTRLETLGNQVASIDQRMDEGITALHQRMLLMETVLEQRFEALMALLQGSMPPKPPEP